MSKEYYVYIMTNKSRTLYTGVTNNLMRRVHEHKNKTIPGFTSKYNIKNSCLLRINIKRACGVGARETNKRLAESEENRFDRINES